MKRSHKIRLSPNNVQNTLLYKTCGCNRYAYNWLLNKANTDYQAGTKYNKFELKKHFNAFKKQLDWMSEVNAHAVINDAIDKLDRGFKNFWEGRAKHPKFHSKKQGVGSFSIAGSEVRIDKQNRRVYIGRIGWIKMTENVRFEFIKLYRITVSNKAGQWFCSFNLEIEDNRTCENQTGKIGIDLGIKEQATCSDGTVIANPRISNKYAARLRQLNKELSRRTEGSKNRWKTVIKLRKLYQKIENVRNDYIHKFTSAICKKYGVVCLEDLHVAGMVKNRRLARHILDAAFGEIRRQFEYKAKEVRYVDRFFPSSRQCPYCGHLEVLTLDMRDFQCSNCGAERHRDPDAAKNIETYAVSVKVSSTGRKKPVAKKTTGRKVSNGQEINSKSA